MKARGENQEKIDSKESFHPFMLDLFAVITLILHTTLFLRKHREKSHLEDCFISRDDGSTTRWINFLIRSKLTSLEAAASIVYTSVGQP